MFRNVPAAALRNLGRNRFYGALSIAGLALGLVAAILTGLYVRSELDYDRFAAEVANAPSTEVGARPRSGHCSRSTVGTFGSAASAPLRTALPRSKVVRVEDAPWSS